MAASLDTGSRRWVAPLLLLVAFALVPWTIVLSWQLPSRHTSEHWDAAWIGFDIALIVALAVTAYALARQRPWVQIPAATATALLLTDAWFDNLLANGTHEQVSAALEAGFGELPLALLCLWIALNAERANAAVRRARGRLRGDTR